MKQIRTVRHRFNTTGTENYRVQLAVPPSTNNNHNHHTETNHPNPQALNYPTNNIVPSNDLNLSIVNFCSITNKRAQLEVYLETYAIDILIGTESHLNESIEVFPSNYQTYRKDRNTFGGGVFISI